MTGAWPMIGGMLALFIGGAAVGDWLARTLAPGSWLAESVGFFALPVAFALSLQAWYGLALFGLITRAVSGRSSAGNTRAARHPPLAGAIVFLPFSSLIGVMAGVVVGLLSPTQPMWLVALIFWVVGTVHGLAGWRLARVGVLMPPETL